jgi:hypothetical protein
VSLILRHFYRFESDCRHFCYGSQASDTLLTEFRNLHIWPQSVGKSKKLQKNVGRLGDFPQDRSVCNQILLLFCRDAGAPIRTPSALDLAYTSSNPRTLEYLFVGSGPPRQTQMSLDKPKMAMSDHGRPRLSGTSHFHPLTRLGRRSILLKPKPSCFCQWFMGNQRTEPPSFISLEVHVVFIAHA